MREEKVGYSPNNDWYKVGAAAKLLGVCPSTIRDWQAAGILKADWITPGGHRLFLRSTLDKMKEAKS